MHQKYTDISKNRHKFVERKSRIVESVNNVGNSNRTTVNCRLQMLTLSLSTMLLKYKVNSGRKKATYLYESPRFKFRASVSSPKIHSE